MLYKTLKHKTKPNTFGQVVIEDHWSINKRQPPGSLVNVETKELIVKEIEVPILVNTNTTLETIKSNYSYFKAMMGGRFDELFNDWELANVKALINEL